MERRGLAAVIGVLVALFAGQSASGVTVLMLTTNNGSLTAVESNLKTLLQTAGHTVNTLWDGNSQANYTAACANNDVVYIPSDITASDVSSKLRAATIGVVNEVPALMDELGLCTTNGTTTTVASITVATNAHYVTSPFSTGAFTIGSSTYAVSRTGGTTASGATILAKVGSVNSVVAVDTGGTLANTINSNSTAAGRRIQMPIQCGVINTTTLSANTQTLIQRILLWAALFEGKLEAHWKLNETSGASAADSSGNSRTGTVTGATSWVAAVLNNGFAFDGATKIQATGLMGNPRNVSVAAWTKLTSADTTGAEIVSLGDHFVLRLDDSGVAKAMFYNGSAYVTATMSVAYAGTGWHHFAAVLDDGHDTLKLYIDGTLAATTSTTASVSWTGLGANTVVGRHGNSTTTSDFTGTLDDVRVYSYAITPIEVAQMFGLIGQWKLNETSGTTASDSTVFARSGALTGTASWSSDCGGIGDFDFSGTSHLFTIASTVDFQPTTTLSIAAWIKGDAWGAGSTANSILKKGDTSPNNYSLQVSDGRVELLLDGTDAAGIRGNTVLTVGQWYHVAATWDGTTAKIYVNGVLDNSPGTAKASPIGTDTRPLYLGGRPAGDYFNGMIRDIRLYNRVLLSSELVRMAGLVGYWKFSEGTGASAADSSGLGNTATLAGGAAWTSDCIGNNNALLTNGSGGIAQTAAPFSPPDVGTVAFWMRSTGAPSGVSRIMGLGGEWDIRQQVDGTVVSDLCGDGATTICTVTPLVQVGRWYHVALTFDSSNDTYAIYVDGQLERSGINPVPLVQQPAAILSFGTGTGTTEYWSGALRDVRIYNRKLCPVEIEDLYGLVLYWKMDETSGSAAADSSGLGRNGTVVGTAAWTAGKLNNAVQLNGLTRVEVASLMGAPKNVTMAAWANLTSAESGGAELISIGDCLAIRLNEGSTTRAFFYNGSTWTGPGVSQMFTSGWHHFAAVFNDDANTFKLYIDGLEVASLTTASSIAYSGLGTKTVVGAHGNGQTTYDWSGKIDDVRIYNRALCPTEIQQIKSLGGTFGGVKVIKWVEVQ